MPDLSFSDYTGLANSISEWMNRADLSGSVQSMIALAEAKMRRKLEPVYGEVVTTLTTVNGVVALPADCGTVNRVVYNYYNIPRWSGYSVASLDDDDYATSPFGYTIEANSLRVWPPVSVALTVYYQQTLPQLTAALPTNDILTKHPDLYFYGAMMFAEGFVDNDNRAAMFKGLFDEGLEEVSSYMRQQRYSGPLVPKIAREF